MNDGRVTKEGINGVYINVWVGVTDYEEGKEQRENKRVPPRKMADYIYQIKKIE